MYVRQLSPGATFRVNLGRHGNIDYRLLYVNECRAYVEPLMRTKRQVTDAAGDVLAEFDAPGGKYNIAPTTECERLDVDEVDDLTGEIIRPAVPVKGASHKRGDIHHDPQEGKRPVRPGTTRAKMLAAIEGGQNSLDGLAQDFGMKRQLVLAHIWELWNSCGYGYTVTGDRVTVVAPPSGVEDLL